MELTFFSLEKHLTEKLYVLCYVYFIFNKLFIKNISDEGNNNNTETLL